MATTLYCDNFVGNAWKKDLCLNCFKSKEEHQIRNGDAIRFTPNIPDPPKEGILKGSKASRQSPSKGNKVNFLNNEFQVIGFGGDVIYSDEEDVEDGNGDSGTTDDDDAYDNEEDRAFQKLTKSNTDYNSIPENLQEPKEGEVKKIIEPLKLGKSVLDEKGNKKTLLISVTPFGDQGNAKNKINRTIHARVNGVDENVSRAPGILKSEFHFKSIKKETKVVQEERNGVDASVETDEKTDSIAPEPELMDPEKSTKNCVADTDEQSSNSPGTAVTETKEASPETDANTGGPAQKVEEAAVEEKSPIDIPAVIFKTKKKIIPVPVESNEPPDGVETSDEMGRKAHEDVDKNKPDSDEGTDQMINSLPSIPNKFLSFELKSKASVDVEKECQPRVFTKLVPNVSSLYRNISRATAALEIEKEVAEVSPKSIDQTSEDYKIEQAPAPEKPGDEPCERLENSEGITHIEATFPRVGKDYEEAKAEAEEIQVPELSRESAGEPDGKADSDEPSDPPALPLKPPPLPEARSNFFPDFKVVGSEFKLFSKKPKVPAKPIIIHSKKINFQSPRHSNRPKSPSMEKFLDVTSSPVQSRSPVADANSKSQKRQAPKPPSPKEEPSDREGCTFPTETAESEEVVRESIRRISRSTENLLELITDKQDKVDMSSSTVEEITVPEPSPRRSLSLSQDSLLTSGIGEVQLKKKSTRGRFSLRKLLHLGRNKEQRQEAPERGRGPPPPPVSKPKPEIIHPSEFNGARIEVLPPVRSSKSRRSSSSASSSSGEHKESEVLSDSSASHSVSSSGNDSHTMPDKAKKPLLPPRAQSLDCWSSKPSRSSSHKIEKPRQNYSWNMSGEMKPDNLYVNLGEARSGLAPNKPMRTGSLREHAIEDAKRFDGVSSSQPEDSGYESFDISFNTLPSAASSSPAEDNVYECVHVQNRSSSPECDSAILDSPNPGYAKAKRGASSKNHNHRRSEGNYDLSQDYFKVKFMRSVSLPYCASETESEIYSPYSFYGSEMGDEDCELSPNSVRSLRISRLKLKKGRSVVHKNLEDNYGAVVIANHEALAQVVDQMRQGPLVPPPLRSLSTAANLRWSDFTVVKDAAGVVVERRVFYPAYWGAHCVTLCLTAEQGLNAGLQAKGPFHLNPLTELNDLVPSSFLPMLKKDSTYVQASISVLTRLQIETLTSYGKAIAGSDSCDESKKEINFVLLQIINVLKSLQAQGIEEAPTNLTNLIVCREERDPHPRVCFTNCHERGDSEASLCQCLLSVVTNILPATDLTKLLTGILRKETAVSLSQAKSILEFTLWGPADIVFGNSARELSLQRWLDLERATVLHGLVRTRAELTVFEEWHLLFLVRTNAKMMTEASLLLETGISD